MTVTFPDWRRSAAGQLINRYIISTTPNHQTTMDSTAVVNAIAAVASAVAAFASVFVAVRIDRRAKSDAETDRRRQEQAADMQAKHADELAAAERQQQEKMAALEAERGDRYAEAEQRRSSFTAVAEWRRDLRGWASEAIDVLSEATYLVEGWVAGHKECQNGDFKELQTVSFTCRHRLSALIDRGRLFLPNIRVDEHGQNKPYAFRGYRHSGLDPLVAAERVLSVGDTGRFIDHKHALIAMKREFVSSIQLILDPAHFNREVTRMISEGNEAVTANRHPLTDSDTIPLGASELLANPPSYHRGLRNADLAGFVTAAG